MKANKIVGMCLIFLMFSLILSFSVAARKGVGVVWETESEIIKEGQQHCVSYGMYNPWDEDVTATLTVSDELKDIIANEESEQKNIPAGTSHDQAIPVEFCFEVADTYERDCLLAGFLCEQSCEDPQVVHEGKILAVEESEGTSTVSAGSATALGVSVPLKLKVQCSRESRNWIPVYVVIIGISVVLIGVVIHKRREDELY